MNICNKSTIYGGHIYKHILVQILHVLSSRTGPKDALMPPLVKKNHLKPV